MRPLEPKHYALIAGFFASIAVQLAGVKHGWGDVVTPAFISGVIAQVGLLIGALYAGAPGATGELKDRRQASETPDTIKDPSRL